MRVNLRRWIVEAMRLTSLDLEGCHRLFLSDLDG